MGQPSSLDVRPGLDDLRRLRAEARGLLDVASLAAREEWHRLEERLDRNERDLVSLSQAELLETLSKVRRFRDILRDLATRRPAG
jgi:hypothetical protein